MRTTKIISSLLIAILLVGNSSITTQAATYEDIQVPSVTVDIQTSAEMLDILSLEDGQVEMKDTNEVEWIDRIKDLPEEVRVFYETLEEATDNDGESDFFIEDQYFSQKNYIRAGTITVTSSDDLNEVLSSYYNYMIAAVGAFNRDHPEVFWINGSYQMYAVYEGNNGWTPVLIAYDKEKSLDLRAKAYRGESLIKAGINERDTKAEILIANVKNGSDYKKVKYFNEVLTKNNEYNTSDDLYNIDSDCRSCIGALRGETGINGPVCEGYARAFKVLCDKEGISCVLVDGNANGTAHMWNYVKLGESWYAVDVTWNDPIVYGVAGAISGYESEDWLLVGADTLIYNEKFSDWHSVSNSPFVGFSFPNGPELHKTAYELCYDDWDEAEAAIMLKCGLSYSNSYTDVQIDLILPFMNKWVALALEATSLEETEKVLNDAKADFDSMKIFDDEAMKAHEEFMKERAVLIREKAEIRDSKCNDSKYTSISRKSYGELIADIMTAMGGARNHKELTPLLAEFDDITANALLELPKEVIDAKNNAKTELMSLLESEYENMGLTIVELYYAKINDCDCKADIDATVQDCIVDLTTYINKNIQSYRKIKSEKVCSHAESFEEELGDNYEKLVEYVREIIVSLNDMDTKGTVDNVYNILIKKIDNKVIELKNESGKIPVANNPFVDVSDNTWYYNAVLWAVNEKITAGTSDITFAPDNVCTRAQVVTFLWNKADQPRLQNVEMKFEDVKEGDWYYYAVLWAVENGITAGTSETTFSPDAVCTRAQVVTFLWNQAKQPILADGAMAFEDVSKADWYYNAVRWAVSEKITAGTSDATFSPNNECTRAQVVTFLWNDEGQPVM